MVLEDWGKVFEYSQNTDTFFSATPTVNDATNLQRNTGFNQTDLLQKFFVPLSSKIRFKVLIYNIQHPQIFQDLIRLDESSGGTLRFAEWYYGPQKRLTNFSSTDNQSRKKLVR